MRRFLNIGALALAILSTAALAATAAMVMTADRGGEDEAPRYDGGIPGTPAPAAVDYGAYIRAPAPAPAPAATATVARDVYIEEVTNPAREVPDLTENQVAEVKRLLSSDPSLNSLLAGESYAIEEMGPWVSGEEREFVGAVVEVVLNSPVSYDGFLPIAESYEKPEDGSGELYVDGGRSYRLQAQGIERLSISVDLNKDKVVTIEVDKAANVDIHYGFRDVWQIGVYYIAGMIGILVDEVEKAADIDIDHEYGFE